MALTNTGKAFYQNLQIAITQGGIEQQLTFSILDAIPNTSFTAITAIQLSQLTVSQAQARYDALVAYLVSQYPGFSAADIMNEPIITNLITCPITI
jgi:hypothetical protein